MIFLLWYNTYDYIFEFIQLINVTSVLFCQSRNNLLYQKIYVSIFDRKRSLVSEENKNIYIDYHSAVNTTIFQRIFKNKDHVDLSSNQRFFIKLNSKSSRLLLSVRVYNFKKIWKYSACVSKLFEVDEFILVAAYKTSRFFVQ